MPDLSIAEAIVLAITTVAGSAGAGVAVSRRRPTPGTPEDHERRLEVLEIESRAAVARVEKLENRMTTTERTLGEALARHAESTDRLWRCIEKLDDSVDKLHATVIRLDVETGIEREERRRRRDTNPGGG